MHAVSVWRQMLASMGPPREHGGMSACSAELHGRGEASMGPPREHGGMLAQKRRSTTAMGGLQWGRRVNTAECSSGLRAQRASSLLQWGRRVNTAECAVTLPVTAGTEQ